MASRGAGHFVITASAAGLLTDLRSAPYAASKHAAVALAEWLAIAHEEDGVAVSCICPEGVKTAMTSSDSRNAADGIAFMEASEAAEAILAGLERGGFLILPHPRVAEFEARRVNDRERWLRGMRRARERLAQAGAHLT
jgi:short-subunit dehydrogenase